MKRKAQPFRRQTAQHQLGQPAHHRRIETVHVVRHARIRRGTVGPHLPYPFPHLGQVLLQRSNRIFRVLPLQKTDPLVRLDTRQICPVHRPVVDLQRTHAERVRPEIVPAVVAVHMRIERLPIAHLGVFVHAVDDAAPRVHVALTSCHQQAVAKTVVGAICEKGPVRQRACLRYHHREAPAVDPAVPLAVARAADRPIQPDIGGDDPAVGRSALAPGVHIVDRPRPVPLLTRQHVGVEGQRRGLKIERMVADNVVVVLEVGHHLRVIALPVPGLESALDLNRIARPIQPGRLAHQRPAAAVEHAADDAVLPVIVVSLRIGAHIEAGKPFHPPPHRKVVRVRQRLQKEYRETLAVVHPVEHHRKLFVVHPVAGEGHINGLCFSILPQMALPPALVQVQDEIGRAQRMQNRPSGQVFGRVIRPVVPAPTGNAKQVAPLVEVAVVEFLHRLGLIADQLPLQQGPVRRRRGPVKGDDGRALALFSHSSLLLSPLWSSLRNEVDGRRQELLNLFNRIESGDADAHAADLRAVLDNNAVLF